MTEKPDVEALVALLERATPGPWKAFQMFGTAPGRPIEICKAENYASGGVGQILSIKDAALIVAAVNELPGLIAHIAGEAGRVAAAVAAERERAADICARAAQGAQDTLDTYDGVGCRPMNLVCRADAARKLAAAIREAVK